MELRAVIEALRVLPDNIHVSVSTNSAYVKRGITEWLPGWRWNGWRNAKGAAVANRTMWEKLIELVSRMPKVEWSWVNGHG
jgi:ribonuclease HI